MAWDDRVAVELIPRNPVLGYQPRIARLNRANLIAAYENANDRSIPLHIPAGTYDVWLDPVYLTAPSGGKSYVLLLRNAPLIGAGSSVTHLNFHYPGGRTPVVIDRPSPETDINEFSTAFSVHTLADRAARIEGLTLTMADAVGGVALNGSDAPNCWGIVVSDGESLAMVDVRTSGWNNAIKVDGYANGASAHLERCHIKSRGTRIAVTSPDRSDASALTLVDCTVEQDQDGFTGFHNGVNVGRTANLVVIGGRSLGNVAEGSYDIYSDGKSGAPARSVAIRDHYFGPSPNIGLMLRDVGSAVLIDNCTFAGAGGLFVGGSTCTYHVTNCAFVGGSGVGSGFAVSDEKEGLEGEAYFTNCTFGAENGDLYYANVVRRTHGALEKPWFFSNCTFGGIRSNGCLFLADHGVNIFHDCRFVDHRNDAIPPLVQRGGRIEIHGCYKESTKAFSFTNAASTFNPLSSLEVIVEGSVFQKNAMLVTPLAPISFRGRGNHMGRIDVDGPNAALITSDFQPRRGRGIKMPDAWTSGRSYSIGQRCRHTDPGDPDAPERVYECTGAGTAGHLGAIGPIGTGTTISDGSYRSGPRWRYRTESANCYSYNKNVLTLGWSADWIELEERGALIDTINMATNNAAGSANMAFGGTIQLYAVFAYELSGGWWSPGNVASTVACAVGAVVSLRFSGLLGKWVIA